MKLSPLTILNRPTMSLQFLLGGPAASQTISSSYQQLVTRFGVSPAQARHLLNTVQKFDPYHDPKGKFTTSTGGSGLTPAPEDRKKWPEHIRALRVPPAWHSVRFNPNPKADLLVIGKDSKNRDQYVYSEQFKSTQSALKFSRITAMANDLPFIDGQIERLRKSKDSVVRQHADTALLIRRAGLRPGSDGDTGAAVHAYGATTLEGRHVVVNNGAVNLQFVGKKGVDLDLAITDDAVAHMLKGRKDEAGDGRLFPDVTDDSLRDFVHNDLDHGDYKTKDFRTLLGTTTAQELVNNRPIPADKKEYVKAVKDVAVHVSRILGNTPAVALQSYIAPQVFAPWSHHAA